MTETQLTASDINYADFGQLYNTPLDGQVYAEPLVMTNVTISAGPNTVGTPGIYNSVVYVATENDSVYAINAASGVILWHRTFLDTTNPNDYLPGATAVTTIPSAAVQTTDVSPVVGITSTPVIDPSTNVLYVEPNTEEIVGGNAYFVQRLHALNLSDGTDAAPSFLIGSTTNGNTNNTPIYVNGTGDSNVNGVVQFNALRENGRPALSLVNGEVYEEWASHGDVGPYHGWVVEWNVTNLRTQGMVLSGVLCTSPNGGQAGIWSGGGGLTFDPDESFDGQPIFYVETSNGDPRGGNPPLNSAGFPADSDYYESLIKVEADPTTTATNQNSNGWGMKVVDYFTPYNVNALDITDEDFGSGSPLVLPDSAGIPGHPHLIVAAGKQGAIYLIDRDDMGEFHVNDDDVLNSVYNPTTGVTTPPVLLNASLSTPAYYHGELYWVSGFSGSAFSFIVAPNPDPNPPTVPVAVLEPTSEAAIQNFGFAPGSVTISANGDEDPAQAIVWIIDRKNQELHAYSALSLNNEVWNSGVGSIATVKFAVPTIANGQVYIGTQNGLQVFGLTGASAAAQAPSAPALASAQALSGTAVELVWTDSTVAPNFATSYAIQESIDGINFTTVADASQESTNYTVTGLSPTTTYYFRVLGSNLAGSSPPSNAASATTTNQTGQAPTAPEGLGATPASGSEVYLTWTNTATNETGFTLTRATDSLFTQNVVTETLASAPYYFTDGAAGLSPGNTYYYELQATNASGESSTSNTASVTIPDVPLAPSDAAAVQTGNSVILSWTDHAGPDALGYQISRSVDGGPFVIYADRPETSDAPPTTQIFTDTNAPPGHTYTYEIVAEDVAGFSDPAYATASTLGLAIVNVDNSGDLSLTASPGANDQLTLQLAAGIYTLADSAVVFEVTGAAAGLVAGSGTSAVTIPAVDVSDVTLDTGNGADAITIVSAAVPITITADSGAGYPIINLGDPNNNENISGTITNAGNGTVSIAGTGTTTITGNLICDGTGGVALAGDGTIDIAGNIYLGPSGNLTDSGQGEDTITGVISGGAVSGFVQGLDGSYFNLTAAQDLIQPAAPSNSAWLGNQPFVVASTLVGPIDFPDVSDNGFADNVGDPAYYNLGAGNNNEIEARWYGDIMIPGTGTVPVPINFDTRSDDGSMLYIDGNTVVNNNNFQGATTVTGLVDLTPGLHAIDVEYYQGTGGASMDVKWDPTGGTNFVDIPNTAFVAPVNGVIMTGTGELVLSATDTYSGSTAIDAGTVLVTANGALGPATAKGIVVNSGGTLAFAGGVNYTTAEPLTISGFGPFGGGAIANTSGANTFAGPITVTGPATIGSVSGSLTLAGNISAPASTLTLGATTAGNGGIIIAGNINLGSAGNLVDSSSGQDTISGAISGSALSGFLQGLSGTYFNLPAAQDQVQPAVASNPAWLGNQAPVVTANLIGPLDFPNIATNGFADSVGDLAYYNMGNGNNNNVEARWYGDITIPGTGTAPVPINFATTSDDGSMLYIDGNLVVSNNNFQPATQETGLVNLSPGLHAIDVEYYQGTLGASMDLQWDVTGGTNFVDIPNTAFEAPVNSLIKSGSGTLTLSNTDSYVGSTTVGSGYLVVNGPLVASGVTVKSGGTLTWGGASTAGTFTPASLSLSASSTFNEDLGGAIAGSQYTQTVIPAGGTVALNGATLNLSFLSGFQPTVGQQFTIIANQGGTSVIGTFNQGSTFTVGTYTFGINYAGGAGHDVVLTVAADNVSSQLRVSKSGLVYNRATQLFGGTITITNIGTTNVTGPLQVQITGLPAGVTLANASGTAPDGNPYITVNLSSGILAPNQSITFTVQFKNPSLMSFAYSMLIFEENPAS